MRRSAASVRVTHRLEREAVRDGGRDARGGRRSGNAVRPRHRGERWLKRRDEACGERGAVGRRGRALGDKRERGRERGGRVVAELRRADLRGGGTTSPSGNNIAS